MDNIQFDFNVEQPIAWWAREFSFDSKEFFTALGKTVVNVAMQDSNGAMENALDMLKSTGLDGKTAPMLAWSLINTALHKSIYNVVTECETLFDSEQLTETEIAELSEILFRTMSDKQIGISADFLSNPKKLSLLKEIETPLTDWLQGLGASEAEASSVYFRLKDTFPVSLHSEWRSDPSAYAPIVEAVASPFLNATKIEREWEMYKAWLQEQANQPVFSEAFGLKQVYVPLRGYYEKKSNSKNIEKEIPNGVSRHIKRSVVQVDEEIKKWVNNFNAEDAVKVISGGPGSGKSSAAKVLAASISEDFPNVSVLFIPLHHFDIEDDLISAVDDFIKSDIYLSHNPLDIKNGCDRLLIIFDGLDELSMRGKSASEAALQFVDEVITKIERFNAKPDIKRQALITGRDVAIQSSKSKLRKDRQVLNLLPYYLSSREMDLYDDPSKLLELDQRDSWWAKYGKAKGKSYSEMPREICGDNLVPITREPLLNYLVALSYERGKIDFDSNITLNEIYADLLQAVHDRKWDRGNHVGTFDLDQKHFEKVLEEIALAIWHGHGRTATISSITEACENANLSSQLELFNAGVKKGVTRLLTAFYFRECDFSFSTENSFEFTHKSFGEYLIARRIIREFRKVHTDLRRHDKDIDYPYDERRAVEDLLKIYGPSPIDQYVYKFLVNEAPSSEAERIQWGETSARLLPYAIKSKWPVDTVVTDGGNETKTKYKYNANRALLILHHVALLETQHQTLLDASHDENVTSWLQTMLPRPVEKHSFGKINNAISNLHLKGISMPTAQFLVLVVERVKFESVQANYSHCVHTSFKNCEFTQSIFNNSSFRSTRFNDCKLDSSSFCDSIMDEGGLYGVHASGTDFSRSNLYSSKIVDSTLEDVVAEMICISRSVIENSDFSRASFIKSIQNIVEYKNVNLSGARFAGAILNNVKFIDSDLSGVDFTSVTNKIDFMGEVIDTSTGQVKMQNVVFENVKIDSRTKFLEEHLLLLPDDLKREYISLNS